MIIKKACGLKRRAYGFSCRTFPTYGAKKKKKTIYDIKRLQDGISIRFEPGEKKKKQKTRTTRNRTLDALYVRIHTRTQRVQKKKKKGLITFFLIIFLSESKKPVWGTVIFFNEGSVINTPSACKLIANNATAMLRGVMPAEHRRRCEKKKKEEILRPTGRLPFNYRLALEV